MFLAEKNIDKALIFFKESYDVCLKYGKLHSNYEILRYLSDIYEKKNPHALYPTSSYRESYGFTFSTKNFQHIDFDFSINGSSYLTI